MDAYKLEPQPGDTNNSETLDHAVLVRTRTPSPRAAPTKNRARSRSTAMASGCSH